MCIRDSHVADEAREHEHGEVAEKARRRVAADQQEQERARACLLYTSDAADERSSVDLGGRRIIKKKNNEPHPW